MAGRPKASKFLPCLKNMMTLASAGERYPIGPLAVTSDREFLYLRR
jgi:hypothetical protein